MKLDDKSKIMLLVGYHSTGAYKLYFPITKKIKISRDVLLKEFGAWDLKKSQPISSVVIALEWEIMMSV